MLTVENSEHEYLTQISPDFQDLFNYYVLYVSEFISSSIEV